MSIKNGVQKIYTCSAAHADDVYANPLNYAVTTAPSSDGMILGLAIACFVSVSLKTCRIVGTYVPIGVGIFAAPVPLLYLRNIVCVSYEYVCGGKRKACVTPPLPAIYLPA